MEATVAVNFILSYLYNKLPRRRVDMFGEMLEQMLQSNLEGFWSSQYGKSTQIFASTNVSYRYTFQSGLGPGATDALIGQAAALCLIDIYEILSYFPDNLTLFIEPGRVQYSVSPSAAAPVDIWRSEQRTFDLLQTLREAAEETAPLTWQKVPTSSSSAGAEGCYIPKSSSTPNFTAATFAQTKFGSTKLKAQLRRSSRISSYLAQQRSLVAAISTLAVLEPTVTTSVSSIPIAVSSLAPHFDSPTGTVAQRSMSLSPCVRGHSPPFFCVPILPPFASSVESMGGPVQFLAPPSIHNTPTTVVTSASEPHQWKRPSDH